MKFFSTIAYLMSIFLVLAFFQQAEAQQESLSPELLGFMKEYNSALADEDRVRREKLVEGNQIPAQTTIKALVNASINFELSGQAGLALAKAYLSIARDIASDYSAVFNDPFFLQQVELYEKWSLQDKQKHVRADNLFLRGNKAYARGHYREALISWEAALDLYRAIGDRSGEGNVLASTGNVYVSRSNYREALELYTRALAIHREIGDRKGQGADLTHIGVVYQNRGQYEIALDAHLQALGKKQEIGDQEGEGIVLSNIAVVYQRVGLYQEALERYNSALAIHRETAHQKGEGNALTNIGVIYKNQSKYEKALDSYQQALAIYREMGDRKAQGDVLTNIGVIYLILGQYNQALNSLRLALRLHREFGHRKGEGVTLANIGIVYQKLGQYDKAVHTLQESLGISDQLGDPETVWRGRRTLGEVLWKSGKAEEAVQSYKQAVEVIERIYSEAQGLQEEARSSLIGKKRFVYQEFLDLLLELHRKDPKKGYDRQALKISEQAKSRIFQDLLTKAGAQTVFAGDAAFQQMLERERQLIGEVTSFRQRLGKELAKPEQQRNLGMIQSLKATLVKAERASRLHQQAIDQQYPRYAELKRPKLLTVEELQGILRPEETLLAYAVGKNRMAAFVIGKERFKLVEPLVGRRELTQLTKQFRQGLDRVETPDGREEDVSELIDLRQFDPVIAHTLYQKIFQPVSKELQGVTRLYLSADDVLYTLPFEALVDKAFDPQAFEKAKNGQGAYLGEYATLHYLVDTYTITYLPSASVLRSLRKYDKLGYGRWAKTLIAFADPIFSEEEGETDEGQAIKGKGLVRSGLSSETAFTAVLLTRSTGRGELRRLKDSAEEARVIAGEVKGRAEDIYVREQATEDNVHLAELKAARYLLFSTHGLLGGDFSGVAEPALALTLVGNPPGVDGFLTMSEVLGLDLNAELIILSACNTAGRGEKAGSGEGFAGLTRSFMYAGTKSLLVTHWSVESQAARDLMVAMFQAKKKFATPKALREAKLAIKKSTRLLEDVPSGKLSLAHPFFWAPFVLVGEGG